MSAQRPVCPIKEIVIDIDIDIDMMLEFTHV
jgi:hypothetical protein